MSKTELTKGEAYAVAEFIDMNIFTAIRSDEEWDDDGRDADDYGEYVEHS